MDQLNSLKADTVGVSSPAVAFGQIYSNGTQIAIEFRNFKNYKVLFVVVLISFVLIIVLFNSVL